MDNKAFGIELLLPSIVVLLHTFVKVLHVLQYLHHREVIMHAHGAQGYQRNKTKKKSLPKPPTVIKPSLVRFCFPPLNFVPRLPRAFVSVCGPRTSRPGIIQIIISCNQNLKKKTNGNKFPRFHATAAAGAISTKRESCFTNRHHSFKSTTKKPFVFIAILHHHHDERVIDVRPFYNDVVNAVESAKEFRCVVQHFKTKRRIAWLVSTKKKTQKQIAKQISINLFQS